MSHPVVRPIMDRSYTIVKEHLALIWIGLPCSTWSLARRWTANHVVQGGPRGSCPPGPSLQRAGAEKGDLEGPEELLRPRPAVRPPAVASRGRAGVVGPPAVASGGRAGAEHGQCEAPRPPAVAWAIMRTMERALLYDQLHLTEIAAFELLARRAQMVELKYKNKIIPVGSYNNDPFDDAHLYQGTAATRGLIMVSPQLEQYVSGELAKEAGAAKERRELREECALTKPPPGR